MKKIYYYLLTTLLVSIATVSCEKFLEEERYTDVGYSYLATKIGMESAINGVYYTMRWNCNMENYFVLTEMGTDLAWDGNDGANKPAFNQYTTAMNSANGIVAQFWSNNYNGINRANTAIMYLPQVPGMTDDLKSQRKAELLFMRAYYYFDLVQHFGAIPLVTKGNVSEIVTDFKRNPESDIYKQIISDLKAAYDVLPDVWQQTDRGRATKWAAAHLLAKVYLTRISSDIVTRGGKTTDLDSAAYYAVKVINSGRFALEANFSNIFAQDNQKLSKEVIWDVQYTKDPLFNGRNSSGSAGGNQIHQYWNMEYQVKPGMIWDMVNESPFKRMRPNPIVITKLWDFKYDARIAKSFQWVYYSNNPLSIGKWASKYYYLNPLTNKEDNTDIIYTTPTALVGQLKFKVADTAIYTIPKYYGGLPYYSTFNTQQAVLDNVKYRKMLSDIAKTPYTLIPMDRNDKRSFPTMIKHLDVQRIDLNDRAGSRNFVRMRLGETYLIAGEAYGRNGDWTNALKYINDLRKRAGYLDGESKPSFVYRVYGGVNNTISTANSMVVTETDVHNPVFPSGAGFDTFVDWMLDERGRELFGELNRWEDLVRTGTLFARAKLYNPDAAPNIQDYHKLRPIPDEFIDRLLPKPEKSEVQNIGYF
jgi:hypothetical protein